MNKVKRNYNVLNSRTVFAYMRRKGMDPAEFKRFMQHKKETNGEEVKLSRRDFRAIEKELNTQGWVCLEKRSFRGKSYVFVGKSRVTIKPWTRHLEKPGVAKELNAARYEQAQAVTN